jgi:hypothetical protein
MVSAIDIGSGASSRVLHVINRAAARRTKPTAPTIGQGFAPRDGRTSPQCGHSCDLGAISLLQLRQSVALVV